MSTTTDNKLARVKGASGLLRFALPNIVMILFISLYSIADGMFVSRFVGPLALSALNMVWPLFSVGFAISFMLSLGGSALVAKLLGEGKVKLAQRYFSTLMLIILGVAILSTAGILLFGHQLVNLMGTTAAQHPYSYDYLMGLMLFAPAYLLQSGFNVFFITAGKPHIGLYTTILAGLANIALDYLFIVHFQWGITGAAYATGLASCIPTAVGAIYFMRQRGGSLLRWRKPLFATRPLLQCCANGSSEMVTHLSLSLTTYLYNLGFLHYFGESGVAAITIVLYLQFIFTSLLFGYAEGVAPVLAFQFGRGNRRRLRQLVRASLLIIGAGSLIVFLAAQISLPSLLHLFVPHTEAAYSIVTHGFPLYAFGFALMGICIFASALFTALSNGGASALISMARTLIFQVCCIVGLPLLVGKTGLWLAMPVAELLGLGLALYLLHRLRPRYGY